jgi:tetratricopeptide (TPR) repeat protein
VKQKVSIFVLGLFLGLVTGFIVTNYLNRPEFAPAAATASGGPNQPGGPPATNAEQPQISDDELAHIIQVVDSKPDDYNAQFGLGEFLMRERQQPLEAIKYYEQASKLKPTESKPIIGLADAHLDAASATEDATKRNELLAKATSYYEKALALEPDNINLRTDMGLTYFFREPPQADRAIAEYRKSLQVDPKHQITLLNLTIALMKKGDLAAAEESLGQLEAVNPKHPRIAQLRAEIEKTRSGQQIPSH